jgi:hypothetical protein
MAGSDPAPGAGSVIAKQDRTSPAASGTSGGLQLRTQVRARAVLAAGARLGGDDDLVDEGAHAVAELEEVGGEGEVHAVRTLLTNGR